MNDHAGFYGKVTKKLLQNQEYLPDRAKFESVLPCDSSDAPKTLRSMLYFRSYAVNKQKTYKQANRMSSISILSKNFAK